LGFKPLAASDGRLLLVLGIPPGQSGLLASSQRTLSLAAAECFSKESTRSTQQPSDNSSSEEIESRFSIDGSNQVMNVRVIKLFA
jgi:hypothetical protein